MIQSRPTFWMRPAALLIAASLAVPVLAGCDGQQNDSDSPPAGGTHNGSMAGGKGGGTTAPPKTGTSTGKKVVVALTGPALLYWLWSHHPQQEGQDVPYFRSESNGQLYYRNLKTGQAHLVTPDPKGYEVTPEEQQQIQKFKGYKNRTTGEDFKPPASG